MAGGARLAACGAPADTPPETFAQFMAFYDETVEHVREQPAARSAQRRLREVA